MKCHSARLLMTRRLHEDLSPAEGEDLAIHLEICPACRAELAVDADFEARLRDRLSALPSAFHGSVPCDPDSVLRHLRGVRRGTSGAAGARFRFALAVAVVGLALFAARHSQIGRRSGRFGQVIVRRPDSSGPRTTQRLLSSTTHPHSGGKRLQAKESGNDTKAPAHVVSNAAPSQKPGDTSLLPGHRRRDMGPTPPVMVPDDQYFDGRSADLAVSWLARREDREAVRRWLEAKLPPLRDDFVQIPLPRIAAADGAGAGDAVRKYEEQAKVVDPRLFHKVALRCKATPLEELCRQLSEQTGVKITASRGVQDEKVTVLVEEVPTRDVMREVARLFGYLFARTGEPGAYRYELLQDLRSQLAEEEMRSRDVHEALIALDENMDQFRPYLDQDIDRMLDRVNRNTDRKDQVANRLFRFVKGGGWGPAQLYFRLSTADRLALISGQELNYSLNDSNPDRKLPADWKQTLLKTSGLVQYGPGTIIEAIDPTKPSMPVYQLPDMEPRVHIHMDRSEAGVMSLWVGTQVSQVVNGEPKAGGGGVWELASGRSPSTSNPENAKANAALKNEPGFQKKVDLTPEPSCRRCLEEAERKKRGERPLLEFVMEPELKEPHVSTADVWEEIHRKTGFPVVTDSYTRIFPVSKVTVKNGTVFDAICQAGDTMNVRWKKDGSFLLGRSTAFFWDKQKEVPERLLRHWQADRDREQGLPLRDLIEMSSLADQQLGSKNVGLGVTHCWGLDEWGIIGGGPFLAGFVIPSELRKQVRGLTLLTPGQLAQAQKLPGLSPRALTVAQVQPVEERLNWFFQGQRNPNNLHVEYVPSGWFVWEPFLTRERYESEGKHWPHVSARTAAEALAQARRWDPNASPSDIHWTRGEFNLVQIAADGSWMGPGGVRVLAPLE